MGAVVVVAVGAVVVVTRTVIVVAVGAVVVVATCAGSAGPVDSEGPLGVTRAFPAEHLDGHGATDAGDSGLFYGVSAVLVADHYVFVCAQ